MRDDWVGIIESIYDVDRPADVWKQSLVDAALPCLPHAGAVLAYSYDASDPSRFSCSPPVGAGDCESIAAKCERALRTPMAPEYVASTYRSLRSSTIIESIPIGAPISSRDEFKAAMGFADIQIANGVDANGHGIWLGACTPEYAPLEGARREIFERIAAHMSAGWRLRRRLGGATDDLTASAAAVLAPDGTVAHAVGDATTEEAREELALAARAIDAARTRGHRADPTLGLAEWRGLVARRWSLLEVFERDGRRFLVAQENALPVDPRVALTDREYEVAALAALNLANKLIAYELGITAATVGVLLHRAMKKLGVADRAGLRSLIIPKGDS